MFKHNYSILLVEDENCARKLIGDRISKIPQVTLAASMSNGFSAQKYLSEHVVDIIFTDIEMPLMNGMELAAFAKNIAPSCPIVFISGHEEFEYARYAIKHGVKEYLLKPIEFTQIVEAVERCCNEVKKRREGLVTSRFRVYEDLEQKLYRTYAKGATAEQWMTQLNELMTRESTIVSIELMQESTKKKDELAIIYQNILSDILPETIVLQLEYTQEKWQYLIIPQKDENRQLLKAVPEYLNRILAEPVEWNEICQISSAQELYNLFKLVQKDERNTQIEVACCYMEQHLGKAITRDEVAESVFLSPTYFSYLFKKIKGVGYNEYLTELRICKAKQLLAQNLSVTDIAVAVGYLDTGYFSNIFRKRTGFTPSEYRRALLDGEIAQEK